MKLRFQADADLRPAILTGVRRSNPGIDFANATSFPPAMSDPEVLKLAASAGRVLVTHDARTMQVHMADFVRASHSPGVILIPQSLSIGSAVRDLLYLWDVLEENALRNVMCRLPSLAIFPPG